MKVKGNKFRFFIDGEEVFDFEEFNRKFENKEIKITANNFDIHGTTI